MHRVDRHQSSSSFSQSRWSTHSPPISRCRRSNPTCVKPFFSSTRCDATLSTRVPASTRCRPRSRQATSRIGGDGGRCEPPPGAVLVDPVADHAAQRGPARDVEEADRAGDLAPSRITKARSCRVDPALDRPRRVARVGIVAVGLRRTPGTAVREPQLAGSAARRRSGAAGAPPARRGSRPAARAASGPARRPSRPGSRARCARRRSARGSPRPRRASVRRSRVSSTIGSTA